MESQNSQFEYFVRELIDAGGEKGKERIKPTESQGKAVIKKCQGRCQVGRESYDENPHIFVIHHINGDANDTITDNLVLLCANCSAAVHGEANRILRDRKLGGNPQIMDYKHALSSLEELRIKKFIKKCAYCNGTGRGDYGLVCVICHGKGKITVKSEERCAYCNGTGRGDYGLVCVICHGTGFEDI